MRVAVVGASGNAGTAVLRRLLHETGIEEIRGVARRPPPEGSGPPYDRVRWFALDIGASGSVESLAGMFREIDAVVHLAWQIQPSHERRLLRRTNVEGSEHVLDACVRAGVPKLVYASSLGAYAPGPKDREVDESWPATGIRGSSYSDDKATVESLLDRLEREHPELTVVRLRPALIFQASAGGEILRYFAGPLAPASLLRYGRLPIVPHSPELRTQAVHADDVADAYVRSLRERVTGAFNIAAPPVLDGEVIARHYHGRTVTVSPSLLQQGADITWRARLQPAAGGWPTMGRNAPLMDCRRAERELGWSPRHDAITALSELFHGMAYGQGTASPVLRPREAVPERASEILHGYLPGHGAYY